MRKQTMVANANREGGREIQTKKKRNVNAAGPEPKPQQAAQVQTHNQKTVGPVELRKFESLLWGEFRYGVSNHVLLPWKC